nr:MoxR family ATPase [Amycolatopsis alba]
MSGNDQDATVDGRTPPADVPDWWIYQGTGRPIHDIDLAQLLPAPPPWRSYRGEPPPENDVPPPDDGEAERHLGTAFTLSESDADADELNMINAALYLRRPLLVTGNPGTGKSSLAYRIARELGLGRVLRWAITSHTALSSGLYGYDAIGRVQAAATTQAQRGGGAEEPPIGDFVRLGPLGTAFLPSRLPRVLLIDELDKSEADLPNDLLSIFEDGEFTIEELARVRNRHPEVTVHTADPQRAAAVRDGRVACSAFPIVIMTSNGEREFPPAFLRRCLLIADREPGRGPARGDRGQSSGQRERRTPGRAHPRLRRTEQGGRRSPHRQAARRRLSRDVGRVPAGSGGVAAAGGRSLATTDGAVTWPGRAVPPTRVPPRRRSGGEPAFPRGASGSSSRT